MKRTKLRWIFLVLLLVLSITFVYQVKEIISPFIVGAVMAYLLSPLVTALEKKGLSRRGAVAVIFIWITVFVVLLLFLLLPKLYLELSRLAAVLPERFQVFTDYVENTRDYYSQAGLSNEVSKLIDKKILEGQNFLVDWLTGVLDNLPGLLTSLGLMILAPILAIYFLVDWKRITRWFIHLVPGRVRGEWLRFLQEIDYIVQRYIQGNLIDGLIVGILIGVSLKLIGMDYALIIGVICGITNLIPYFGPVLGWIPAVLLAFSKSPLMALKVTIAIFIIQQIDSDLINPRLMSGKIGLHPLWVVFALLAGGELAGILGMFIAIPVAAIVRIVFRNIYFYLVAPKNLKTTRK